MCSMSDFTVMIPARFGSERLPGKPLRPLAGRAMIEHVYRRARESGASRIVVATDDERIASAANGFGAEVVMTASSHQTGTDRLAEVVARLGIADDATVVNLQGDEPLMPPMLLARVAAALAQRPDADIATLAVPMDVTKVGDPNLVKVVVNHAGSALYFSRAPIPHPRQGDAGGEGWLRHLGLYAYRGGFLRHFPELAPPEMERQERLEQLRALWHGYRVVVEVVADAPPAGVDTEADMERVSRFLRQ